MKKSLCLLVCLALIFTAITSVSAAPQDDKSRVTFVGDEIKDQKVLQDRMDKGITDDTSFVANCTLSQDTITGDDGKQYKLKVKSVKATSQKLKETSLNETDVVTEYSGNIVAEVSLISPMIAPGGGDDTTSAYDSDGLNAKLYVHCIYLWGVLNNNPYYKITQLSGKLVKIDPLISLNKIDIKESCFGGYYTAIDESTKVGQGGYNMTATTNYPTSDTYYYNNSLSPYFWNIADGSTCYVNGVVTGYFQRGSTQWSANVSWHRP